MRVLVTGATGKVGNGIASALLARGDEVAALVRDPARAAEVLPAGAEAIRGDATEPESLDAAAEGCELVFNSMGIPEQWTRDDAVFDRVNAEGSRALARAAKRAGARRLIHTSTFDVFHAERGGHLDETQLADYPKGTAYERSKQRAEELVLAERDGLEVVIVNPCAVYGPGPSASVSFDEGMFEPLVRKRLPVLPPGGAGMVFTDGVVNGHLLAAEKGRDGERYILSDTYVDFRELAETVVRVAGRGRVPPVMPLALARAFAAAGEGISRVIKRPPMISRGQVYFFSWQAHPDSSKAQSELGWKTTPLEEGIRLTLEGMSLA
ncbi:MAG: NAD-dependent epimerase/dehydratase family protein [Solirubrobacterales bacterium]|nr:NAD-dependent epimerase/dehydratase family protein [Solirubrobacterales bacterium]